MRVCERVVVGHGDFVCVGVTVCVDRVGAGAGLDDRDWGCGCGRHGRVGWFLLL